ncbi:hypothetical protein EGR_03194 [Echinococcus granulosus]|uniref:Uncharacterized protein n=1 Tax=Echinococcus granulosus TaxID=6210 RepID=W6UL97_ECHGR|nr:hypothetical protein EGR_03194 [Echinococcus granulosus]EUB61921.1 hypothetical protein EGR_03194 [Echinococcus granulosus]
MPSTLLGVDIHEEQYCAVESPGSRHRNAPLIHTQLTSQVISECVQIVPLKVSLNQSFGTNSPPLHICLLAGSRRTELLIPKPVWQIEASSSQYCARPPFLVFDTTCEFYIDPNGGHWRDSFPVQCQLGTLTTVIPSLMKHPKPVGLSRIVNNYGSFWYATAALKSNEAVSKPPPVQSH